MCWSSGEERGGDGNTRKHGDVAGGAVRESEMQGTVLPMRTKEPEQESSFLWGQKSMLSL